MVQPPTKTNRRASAGGQFFSLHPSIMKISPREIQLFVAGAFALLGYLQVTWLFHYANSVQDTVLIVSRLISVLTLPLGIGILLERERAVSLTLIYLWVMAILGFTGIPIYCFVHPAKAMHVIWREAPEMLSNVTLLGLMVWSRSRRFRHEPDA